MSATVRIWVLSDGDGNVLYRETSSGCRLFSAPLEDFAQGAPGRMLFAMEKKDLKDAQREWNEVLTARFDPEDGVKYFVRPMRLRVSLSNSMTLNVRDDREPWLIHYGRQLAEAVMKEKAARAAHEEAVRNMQRLIDNIAELGELINRHLGAPEENKVSLEGELER